MDTIFWIIGGAGVGYMASKLLGAFIEGVQLGMQGTIVTWIIPYAPFIATASFIGGLFWSRRKKD